jgi:hypothetical protein
MKEVVKVFEVVWLFMLVVSSVIAHVAFKVLDDPTTIDVVIGAIVLANIVFRLRMRALSKAIDEETASINNAAAVLDLLKATIKRPTSTAPSGTIVDTIIVNEK